MFERFTESARATVVRAQEEARALAHPTIGSQHLLLGLLQGDEADRAGAARACLTAAGVSYTAARAEVERLGGAPGLDADALRAVGIDLDEVRPRVAAQVGAGALAAARAPRGRGSWLRRHRSVASGHLPFGEDGRLVLELAVREAVAYRSGAIESGHLLLGLLRAGAVPGVAVLQRLGIDSAALRTEVLERLRKSA